VVTYGYEIVWRNLRGDRQSCEVSGCRSVAAAKLKAVRLALRLGWTPPRWWQFWRWHDTQAWQVPSP
jgi:hypothetical protein